MFSMTRRLAAWSPVLLALAFAACGGGDGGSNGGGGTDGGLPASGDYFPLNTGDVWYYSGAATGDSESRVTGTRTVGGRSVVIVTNTDASGSSEDLYEKTSAGVLAVVGVDADAFDVAIARIPVLPAPLIAGAVQVPLDQVGVSIGDIDGDRTGDTAVLHAVVTVVGFEAMGTPAGNWTDVAHVRTVLTERVTLSSTRQVTTVTLTADEWFAPGVGIVRSEYVVVGEGGNERDQRSLQAFRVGALRSETVAPTIAARSPAAGSVAAGMVLTVSFSEAMDRRTPAVGDALEVMGPDGLALAGSVRWQDDRTLAFTPAGLLATGRYVARVGAGVQDRVGNTVASEREWSFEIDRKGPAVVSVDPADGAVEVPLEVSLRVVFDEAPDPASVTQGTAGLTQTGTWTTVPTRLSLDGRTLTVTPLQPLQRAQHYEFTVYTVRDALGNYSPITVTRFGTDAGRFAPAQALPGLARVSSSIAIADLDGDRRADLVVTGFPNASSNAFGAFILRQQADGTLAAAEPLGLQPACDLRDLTTADVDADGRADLIVSHLCGFDVLRQTAGGRLATTDKVTVAPLGVTRPTTLRTASGRRAVVALPVKSSGPTFVGEPTVWRQDASGQFTAPETVPSALRELYRMVVADLDGDGLDDLVMWGLLSDGRDMGVDLRLQRADGSFGPSRELKTPYCESGNGSGLDAGDVNGDGRTDLVVFARCGGGTGQVVVLTQDAAGNFAATSTVPTEGWADSIRVADVDGDGRADVVTHSGVRGVGVLLQRADGTLSAEAMYSVPDPGYAMALGDLNGDGRVDIAAGSYWLRQKPTTVGTSAARPGSAAIRRATR